MSIETMRSPGRVVALRNYKTMETAREQLIVGMLKNKAFYHILYEEKPYRLTMNIVASEGGISNVTYSVQKKTRTRMEETFKSPNLQAAIDHFNALNLLNFKPDIKEDL